MRWIRDEAAAFGGDSARVGARLVMTLVHEPGYRPDARWAPATMYIGVGQGIAMVLETEHA